MPRRLIVVNGTMGVGKTAVCRELIRALPGNTAWLDGDWCWTMHPFRVSEENKRMVEGNIVHVLRSFLTNSSYDQVVFSWVIHQPEILEGLLARLGDLSLEVRWFTLVADEATLRERMLADGRGDEVVEASVARLKLYAPMPSSKIDTTGLSAEQAARMIVRELEVAGSMSPVGEGA